MWCGRRRSRSELLNSRRWQAGGGTSACCGARADPRLVVAGRQQQQQATRPAGGAGQHPEGSMAAGSRAADGRPAVPLGGGLAPIGFLRSRFVHPLPLRPLLSDVKKNRLCISQEPRSKGTVETLGKVEASCRDLTLKRHRTLGHSATRSRPTVACSHPPRHRVLGPSTRTTRDLGKGRGCGVTCAGGGAVRNAHQRR